MTTERQGRRQVATIEEDPKLAEMAAIGYILLYPQRYHQLAAVKPVHFADEKHAQVWEILTALVETHGNGINQMLVSSELTRRALFKTGEVIDFLVDCQDHARNAPDPEAAGASLAGMIIDSGLRRQMRFSADKLKELSHLPAGTDDVRAELQAEVFSLLQYETAGNHKPLEVLLDEQIKALHDPYVEGPTGIMTGHAAFDDLFNGFKPGNFVVVSARPSIGKTSLATQWAIEWGVKQGIPGGVWSLEMELAELIPRMACQMTGLDGHRIGRRMYRPGDLQKLEEAMCEIRVAVKNKTLQMMDSTRTDGRMLPKSITDIVAEVRYWKNRTGLKWIVVDYIQRISGIRRRGESREREVASVSGMLKQLAMEAGITVVAISSMGRPSKDSPKKRPTMYELRESGQLEFDADFIVLLHNYFLVDQNPDKPLIRPERERAEIILAKQRNGRTGIAPADFVTCCGRWEALSSHSDGGEDMPWQQQQQGGGGGFNGQGQKTQW